MKKTMLIALSLLCSVAMAETKLNFSGDAYVRGYFKNGFSPDKERAINQFFRLNADAKVDDNLTVKTGLVLSGNSWEGDMHTTDSVGGIHEDGFGKGDTTRLDHAQIEYTKDGWVTSVGRMAVTSPGSFLTSDDRRDRVQVLKIFPSYDVLALVYDKRYEGTKTNSRDDLDMYSVNYYGTWGQFKYALQSGYWIQKNPAGVSLDNIKQITPQLVTTIAGINLDFYYTILWGGSTYYKNDHHSMALKLSKDLEVVKAELETIMTRNGGLIAGGFDSLSSIVNNSADHNQSAIKLRTIGFGLGAADADEYMSMARFSKAVMPELTLSLGAGVAKFYVSASNKAEKNTIVDATAKYDFSKALALNAKYGKFFGDNKDHAGSLTLSANF